MPLTSSRSARSAYASAAGATVIGIGLVLALTACTSPGLTGQAGLADASASPSAPGPTPTTPATSPASSTGTTAGTATTRPYPSDYAGAVLTAWASHDTSYLTLLTDAATVTKLYGTGDPDQHWTTEPPNGAAGSTYAPFYNQSGDMIVIRLDNAALTARHWHAGQVQSWDPIAFPTDAHAYAKAFMDAWINGNKTRMVRLSSQAFTDHVLGLPTPDSSYTIANAPGGNAAGHAYLEITDAATSLDLTIVVATPVLGSPGAIEDCAPTCV